MRITSFVAVLLLACGCLFAQTNKPSGGASPAQALPHDQHDGITISADPYTDTARAKDIFGKANPVPAGILPVEVFVRNDADQPMHINLATIQMEVHLSNGRLQNIDWLTPKEVANAIAHPGGTATPRVRRLPIGIPGKDKNADKLEGILKPLLLDSDVVGPKEAIHGFLFFDVNHELSLVPTSSLYVPDVMFVPSNKALIFFEVPLSNSQTP